MIQLKLYGTEGCHLCDQALELVHQAIAVRPNITLQYIDIVEDEGLMSTYALTIPVLSLEDQTSLFWPFSVKEITDLINGRQ
ncbi:MAG TPA: glutaredoxin family protein [Methylovorus sp.]|jgi:hypothetical protein|nr:glutaredoxin family protein [Methylovorus sp.]